MYFVNQQAVQHPDGKRKLSISKISQTDGPFGNPEQGRDPLKRSKGRPDSLEPCPRFHGQFPSAREFDHRPRTKKPHELANRGSDIDSATVRRMKDPQFGPVAPPVLKGEGVGENHPNPEVVNKGGLIREPPDPKPETRVGSVEVNSQECYALKTAPEHHAPVCELMNCLYAGSDANPGVRWKGNAPKVKHHLLDGLLRALLNLVYRCQPRHVKRSSALFVGLPDLNSSSWNLCLQAKACPQHLETVGHPRRTSATSSTPEQLGINLEVV